MTQLIKETVLNLSVLTFNIWGLPFSKNRVFRIHSIGKKLSTIPLDIIGLQEAWLAVDRKIILKYLALSGIHYSYYFESGLLGSGLFLLSRYPIIDVAFHRYSLNGKFEKIWHGDYYGGKGIGLARIQTPIGLIDVYNTQPVAQYSSDIDDEYRIHRTTAMYEAAKFINTNSSENPIIALGDFNTRPDQFEFKIIRELVGLVDCYPLLYPNDPGVTITPENRYKPHEIPKRIDYIFIKDGYEVRAQPISGSTTMKSIPGNDENSKPYFYSDHFGVQILLRLSNRGKSHAIDDQYNVSINQRTVEKSHVYIDLLRILQKGVVDAEKRRRYHFAQAIISLTSLSLIEFIRRLVLTKTSKNSNLVLASHLLVFLYAVLQSSLSLIVLPMEIKYQKFLIEEINLVIRHIKTVVQP